MASETLAKPARLGAVERLVEDFEARAGNGAAVGPAWLAERSRAAFDRFREAGFPTTRQEAWRFTDVKPIAEAAFAWARPAEPGTLAREVVARELWAAGAPCAVFVNGTFAESLSTLAGLPADVTVGSLWAAVEQEPELVERHLGRHVTGDANPFTELNSAFIRDGAFVHVPRDAVLDRPIHLLHLSVGDGGAVVTHPRNLIVVERGAQASVVESYASAGEGRTWTNVVTEVVVGENANLDTYRVQRQSPETYHTAATHSHQGRSSVYSCVTFAFGAALARHDIGAVLDGEGAECTLNGLSLLSGRQHADHHTTIDHAKPHGNSWEYFNGIFDGRSRGVFNGRIIVRPGAQRTDSKQTNNNLLLSRSARADSQPQLEIYADDVKCTHGAALGPIDERQLFYLESRGLPPEQARNLLTYGFAVEILSTVTLEDLRNRLDTFVRGRLAGGAGGEPTA